MNSGATADRVYDGLKRRIVSGDLAPGSKLEPGVIAEDLMSSATPVRDALHRLIGERLVEARAGEGFYLPHLSEPTLADLYVWTAEVLALALRARDRPFAALPARREASLDAVAVETASLFAHIAHGSDNGEHRAAIEAASDRVHRVRLVECQVLDDVRSELDDLRQAAERDDVADLRKLVGQYHRRRQRHTAQIVRALYRSR